MTRTISTKTQSWLSNHSTIGPEDLRDPKNIVGLIFSNADMRPCGWTYVGEAEITVELVDESKLIDNKVAALREELKTVRAEAQIKSTKIEGQIQSLLCIENNPSAPA